MAFADLVARGDAAVLNSLGGESIVYAPAAGSPVTVTGIFESNFPLTTAYGMSGDERNGPSVFLRVADLATNPDTDDATLTIRGLHYKVRERSRDGLGGIHLSLYEVT